MFLALSFQVLCPYALPTTPTKRTTACDRRNATDAPLHPTIVTPIKLHCGGGVYHVVEKNTLV
jgi:hypothetical protein